MTISDKLRAKFEETRLDNLGIGMRVAQEFRDGDYVNIGFGIPSFAPSFVPEGRTVILQVENGVLNCGGLVPEESPQLMDHDLTNAGFRPILPLPGMSFFDSAQSFAMIRGGHLDVSVVGAFQVTAKGDLASWSRYMIGGKWTGILGGAMEVTIAKTVVVAMEHISSDGECKIVNKLTLPLTRKACVDMIITDVAVMEVTPSGLVLTEVAPGWSAKHVQEITEPQLIVSPELKEMQLG
ncbi:MAG: CoA-transferase [Chloroflexota bacterium]|nr:CoA-transferase [Chloroflexota bacterium]